jgi:uncharacterized protein (TIRG00374 family)
VGKIVKRIIIYLVFLGIVSILTLYFLNNFGNTIEWGKIIGFFLANFWGLYGVISLLISWLADAMITYILMNKLDNKPFTFSKSFNMSIIGTFFNKLSPASTGGGIFQIAYLKRNGVNFGNSFSVVELRFIIKQSAMVLMAIVGFMTALTIMKRDQLTLFLTLIGFVLSVSGILILILINVSPAIRNYLLRITKWAINLLRFSKKFKSKIPEFNKKAEKEFDNYVQSTKIISQNWPVMIFAFLFAIISALAHLFLAFAAIQSFGIFENVPKGFLDVIAVQAIATMIIYFSPTPGSAGIAEGGFYLFFSTLVPLKFLSTVTLEWRILSYFVPLILSGLIFFGGSINRMMLKDKNSKEGIK